MTPPQPGLDYHCEHFDPVDPETVKNLWPIITHIRETCPVAHSDARGGFWLLTRYADVAAASQNWEAFSSAQGTVWPREGEMKLMDLIEQDPPEHRRWRKIFNPMFTPSKVAELEPVMRQVTTELIDEFIELGAADLSKDFAQVLPGTVFFKIAYGISDTDLRDVHRWVRALMQEIGPKSVDANANLVAWLKQLLTKRLDSGERHNDLVDAVLHTSSDTGPASIDELVPIMMLLTFAGLDTIQNATGNIALRLCREPDLAEWLREDLTRIPRAVHEFLRIDPPPVMQTRVTTRDVEVGGRTIPANQRVALCYGAANRDPAEFADPEIVRFDRPHSKHLAFGMGVHRCLGSHYAALELTIVIEQLVTRLQNLRLADPDADIPFSYPRGRGPLSLKVTFDPGPRLTERADP